MLSCLAEIAMMEATDHRLGHDGASLWRLDFPRYGRVVVERLMSAGRVVVLEVVGQDAFQVPFI
jgi:hypothetical protein